MDVGWWCTFCGSGIAAIVIVLVWCQIFYCDGVVVQVVAVACFFIDWNFSIVLGYFPFFCKCMTSIILFMVPKECLFSVRCWAYVDCCGL